MRSRLVIIVIVLCGVHAIAQETYIPAMSSEATFVIKNLGVSVDGKLKEFSGKVVFDELQVEKTSFDITVPLKTLNTGIALRDKHLKKEEYFDVDQYPVMHFVSNGVTMNGQRGVVTGVLTIKKKSLPVEVICVLSTNLQGLRWEGSFELNRRNFDVGGGSFSMGDTVKVKIVLICVKS